MPKPSVGRAGLVDPPADLSFRCRALQGGGRANRPERIPSGCASPPRDLRRSHAMARKGFPSTLGSAGLAFSLFVASRPVPLRPRTSRACAPGTRASPGSPARSTPTALCPRRRPVPARSSGSISGDFDDGPALLTSCWNGETPVMARHVCANVGTPGCPQVNGNLELSRLSGRRVAGFAGRGPV